jgi:DNA-binding transcriptional regulator YiaG
MTHMTEAKDQPVEELLRTDELGRIRTSATRREQLLDEFERSGLSGKKFAALVGVKYQTFTTWAQKRRRKTGSQPTKPKSDPVKWLEAVVEQPETHTVLVLHVPGGVRVEINDPKQLPLVAELLHLLAQPC